MAQGSFNIWEALRAPFWKGGCFGTAAYSGPPLNIAADNGNQSKVLDPAGQPMNLSINSGSSRGRAHFNNPNGFTVSGALSAVATPTITPTGGSGTSYSYKVVARASNGTAAASTAGTTSTGGATLSSTIYNSVIFTLVTGAISYDIYRSASSGTPSSVGYIGNIVAGSLSPTATTATFVDYGIAGDSRTAPTVNTTGVFEATSSFDLSVIGLAAVQSTAITNGGTVGSTAYSYKVSAVTATGTENPTAAAASTSTGNATLTTTNYNTITWAPVPGAVSYNVYRTASSGTPGTTGLIINVVATASATSVTTNDTGIVILSATIPTANTTGSITSTGGLQQQTTVTANQAKHLYAGYVVPAATTSGTDTAGINGTLWISEVFVPASCSLTGIAYLIGSVGGTDKVVVALFDAAGNVVANSAVDSSVTVGTTATFQRVPFTAVYQAVGPAKYYIGVQYNGATAKIRTQVFGNHETTSISQTFNTLVAITPPTTFTASVGATSMLY